MDGSAAPFVFLIQAAGVTAQSAVKKFLVIRETIRFGSDEAFAELQPYDGFALKYTLDYDHPVFAQHEHTAEVNFCSTSFIKRDQPSANFWFFSRLRETESTQSGQGR